MKRLSGLTIILSIGMKKLNKYYGNRKHAASKCRVEGERVMTKEEILSMSAGYELNALICEKVFGAVWCKEPLINGRAINAGRPYLHIVEDNDKRTVVDKPIDYLEWMEHESDYSRDIGSVWLVVEKFESLSIHKGVLLNSIGNQLQGKCTWDKGYKCEIVVDMPNFKTVCAVASTAPEAICKAALLAITDD